MKSTPESPSWFGGVGLMISGPQTTLEFSPAPRLTIAPGSQDRVAEYVRRWFRYVREVCPHRFAGLTGPQDLPVSIHAHPLPPPHNGLGAGTQLALATGQGLTRFFLSTDLAPEELARSVGRGLRSAVGTHGFFRGGLIVDRGKTSPESLGILDGVFYPPQNWRVLLLLSRNLTGLHGPGEVRAFQTLPAIPPATTQKLQQLTRERIVPAIAQHDFAEFSSAIYEYGLAAGRCFSEIQGGPFASPRTQAWVDRLRSWGVAGVGQSSWGPTLFCFAEDGEHAQWIARKIQVALDPATEQWMITEPQRTGFQIDTAPAGETR
jgi:beta-RFAP synthase